MVLQIAENFSQYSDSLLNAQSEHQLPTPMLLLVILPRLILLIEPVSHVTCQSVRHVPRLHLAPFSAICWNPKSLALISPIEKIGRKVDSLSEVIQSTCGIESL